MAGTTFPFAPSGLPTVTLAVTATTGNVALGNRAATSQDASPTPDGEGTFPGGFSVRVMNGGTKTMFVTFGGSTVTATVAAGTPMLAGTAEVFTVNPNATYIAAICGGSDSTTLYATTGQGI